jgi:glucosamine--fructose-6-phosphate aminotransferase (isomerizing)
MRARLHRGSKSDRFKFNHEFCDGTFLPPFQRLIVSATREPPPWYQEWFPEWRAGPPWVMRDMVFAQPDVAAEILADSASARELADAIRWATDRERPIVVVACGTSEHAAQAIAEVLEVAIGIAGAVEPRQAFDAALAARQGGLCVAISHGGMSKATVSALAAARSAGAQTALITAAESAPTHAIADLVVSTPRIDASWCHTIGYTSPIIAAGQAAAIYAKRPLDGSGVTSLMHEALSLEGAAREVAAQAAGVDRVLTAGSGVDRAAARELALKIAEGAHLPAAMLDLENVLHGHLAAHDARTLLVLIVTDEAAGRERAVRARQVLQAARHIGLRTAIITNESLAGLLGERAENGQWLVLPAASEVPRPLGSILGGAIGLQLLTLGVVDVRGTNPDLLRRDEKPWWEATAIGESKFVKE